MSQPEYIEAALAAGKHVLSEKPIAADIQRAEQLISYYKSDKVKGGATWGIAENFRFLDSFEYGAKEVQKLGRILGFRVKMFANVKKGGKYFGELSVCAGAGHWTNNHRNSMEKETRVSRRILAGWRCSFRRGHTRVVRL